MIGSHEGFGKGGLNLSPFCSTMNHSSVMGEIIKKQVWSPNVRCIPTPLSPLITPPRHHPSLCHPPLSLSPPRISTEVKIKCIRKFRTNLLRTDQRTSGPTDQWTDRPTDEQNNGPMDRRMDRPSYRDAKTHLKTAWQNLVILVVFLDTLGLWGGPLRWQMSDAPPQEGTRVGQIRKT